MELKEFIDKQKSIQQNFLDYLNDDNSQNNDKFYSILDNSKIKESRFQLNEFIHLLVSIFNNHHRSTIFLTKIKEILLILKIDQTFSNYEIYNFFKSNNLLLLLVVQSKILPVDEFIKVLKEDNSSNNYQHFAYFWPEINGQLTEKQKNSTEQYFKEQNYEYSNFEIFDQKRSIGENDHYICEIIRNDKIEEFVAYVNKNNINCSSEIRQSIFETNAFLMNKNVSLIEYASFFGSIRIVQYLITNGVEIKPSLWFYIIHSSNAELIQMIEDKNVKPDSNDFAPIFYEAIKCHHNDIAEYFQNNYLKKLNDFQTIIDPLVFNCFQFFNYKYFPKKMDSLVVFFDLCKYDYPSLLEVYLKSIDTYVNQKIIFKKKNLFHFNFFVFSYRI